MKYIIWLRVLLESNFGNKSKRYQAAQQIAKQTSYQRWFLLLEPESPSRTRDLRYLLSVIDHCDALMDKYAAKEANILSYATPEEARRDGTLFSCTDPFDFDSLIHDRVRPNLTSRAHIWPFNKAGDYIGGRWTEPLPETRQEFDEVPTTDIGELYRAARAQLDQNEHRQ